MRRTRAVIRRHKRNRDLKLDQGANEVRENRFELPKAANEDTATAAPDVNVRPAA